MKLVILLGLISFSAFAQMYDDVKGHFRINAKEHFEIEPAKPTTIEVWFTDTKTKEVIKDYKEMHGKIMHMVLIKKDLSVFKHIHPYFDPVTGIFQITLNLPLADPDNFHTANALVEPGMFMLMADVEPRGYGMRMDHVMLKAKGSSPMRHLTLDQKENSIISKYFDRHGRKYRLDMQYWTTPGCNGELVEIMTTLYEMDLRGEYLLAQQLEPWLGAGAHSVWVSEGMMNNHNMHFAHMHSKIPEEGSSHVFSFHDLNIMKPGKQKIWFQLKQRGNVLTVPIVFDYQLSTEQETCK